MAVETTVVWNASGVASGAASTGVVVPAGESVSVFISTGAVGTGHIVTVQWSVDGTNWATADPTDAFPALVAISSVCKAFTPKGKLMRLTITAGTGNSTFTATVAGQETNVVHA